HTGGGCANYSPGGRHSQPSSHSGGGRDISADVFLSEPGRRLASLLHYGLQPWSSQPGRQRSSAAFFATRQEEPAVFHQAGWRSPGGNDSGAASPLHHYTFELALRPDRLHGAGPHPDPVQLALERAPGQAAPGARPKPVFIA